MAEADARKPLICYSFILVSFYVVSPWNLEPSSLIVARSQIGCTETVFWFLHKIIQLVFVYLFELSLNSEVFDIHSIPCVCKPKRVEINRGDIRESFTNAELHKYLSKSLDIYQFTVNTDSLLLRLQEWAFS